MNARTKPRLRFGLVWLLAIGCFALLGCSRKSGVVPVSGRVTLDGQPLANVAVNFGPLTGGLDGAYASYAKTDAEGRYTLKLVDDGRRGAAVGKNRVTLNESGVGGESDGAAPRMQFKLPPTARDGTLHFDVPPGGTDAANFEFGESRSLRPERPAPRVGAVAQTVPPIE